MFDRLVWADDRILIDDVIFFVGHKYRDAAGGGDGGFIFVKGKRILDQYAALWSDSRPPPDGHMLELGIHDGGSIAFWCEILKPARYSALDLQPWGDTPYFNRYVESRGLQDRVRTHWRTNQADADALRRIVADDLGGRLDLVLDDASHLYEPTRASFETLFPLVRPGGWYVIEDWSWGLWRNLPDDFPLPRDQEPSPLAGDIARSAGCMSGFLVGSGPAHTLAPLISRVVITGDLIAVLRGPADAAKAGNDWLPRATAGSSRHE